MIQQDIEFLLSATTTALIDWVGDIMFKYMFKHPRMTKLDEDYNDPRWSLQEAVVG